MGTTTKGILTPRDIDEEGRYYFVRKAMDAGDVVRLKNGVYATEDGLADTMVDVERIVPGGVLCLYSAWEHYGLTTQIPGSIYVAVEKHRKVVVPDFPPITLCYWEKKYYADIRKNPLACLIKCLDRVNNLSGMADGFSREKMKKYTAETDKYYPPLLDEIKKVQEWNDAWWLLRYQMTALLETFKRML